MCIPTEPSTHIPHDLHYSTQVIVNVALGFQHIKSVLKFHLESFRASNILEQSWPERRRVRSSTKFMFRVPRTSRWSPPVLNLLITETSLNACLLSVMVKVYLNLRHVVGAPPGPLSLGLLLKEQIHQEYPSRSKKLISICSTRTYASSSESVW